MKTKILYSITALLILTFAFVVYASVSTSTPTIHASDDKCCAMKDCCKDGKCSMNNGGKCNCAEMHKKDGASAKHECNSDCCKYGKCETHKKDGEATAMKGDCCKGKDSCPMKDKKDGDHKNHKDN